ncbi:hypothetical protein DIS24_g1369 [Lasiodiplodia hormozganensis]|uniref:Uncharacterized protein n=1 Tax=Lasiodiplodia hormozganensis TaxID=869390 RepID=A0AA40D4V3_9PEZI|nr:hypothetical protein DIS24_g1369 [Lasiodiplodia hormozganensis]
MATPNSNINAPTEQTTTTIRDEGGSQTTNPRKSAPRPSAAKPNNNQSSGSKPPKRTKKKLIVASAAVVKQEQQPAQNDSEKQQPSSKSTKKKKKAKNKNKSEGDDNGTNRTKDNNQNNISSSRNPNVSNRGGNSTNTPGRHGQPPTIPCDCGRKFQTMGALQTHRENAKAHGPFRDRPAMVLMKALGEAPPALIEGARLNSVTVGGNDVLGKDEGEVTNVHLCECGRVFDTWTEVYKHLPGSSVHTPGSQVAVYTGKVRRRGEEGKDQEKEASSLSSSRKSRDVETVANDTKISGAEDRSSKGGVQCSCGKTLKDANALRNHQRQSAKHRSSPETAAGDSGSKQKQTSTINPIFANQAAETSALPSSSSAKKAKPPKPKYRSQRDRPGRSGGGGGGGPGGSSSSGYGYTSGNFGYGYGYGYGFGDGYDWGLCDKDCGWCGHCMDGVDI